MRDRRYWDVTRYGDKIMSEPRTLANGEVWTLGEDGMWRMPGQERIHEGVTWEYAPVSEENFESYVRTIEAQAARDARRVEE